MIFIVYGLVLLVGLHVLHRLSELWKLDRTEFCGLAFLVGLACYLVTICLVDSLRDKWGIAAIVAIGTVFLYDWLQDRLL